MVFPPEFLDELRLRLPPSQVVGRKVKLVRRGREHSGLCPFHKEKTPSFTVNDDKGFYHCFGCGAHGDIIGFAIEMEGLSFPEAVERLAGEAGLEVPRSSPEDLAKAERRASLIEVLEKAAAWFQDQLAGSDGAAARAYLEGRGVAAPAIAQFRLGFAPDRRGALTTALSGRGITEEDLIQVGLLKRREGDSGPPRDYFFNRLIFPVTDRRGRVIAFGGRAMGESPAKYINSPDTTLFHKGRVLYNLAGARKAAHDSGEVIVAEGYMDVIALAEGGFPAAVAPLGTAVTEDQIHELWRLAREPLVCLDGDEAGQRAAFRLAERALPLLQPGYSLRFCWLPRGEDPDTFLRSQGAPAFRELLRRQSSLSDVLWLRETYGHDFSTPERRAALRQNLRQTLQGIPDQELREDFRGELMARYDQVYGRQQFGRQQFGRQQSGRHQSNRGDWPRRGRGPAPAWASGRAAGLPPPAPGLLARRQEQLLLALSINHTFILEEYLELLDGVVLQDDGLQRLRGALLDAVAEIGGTVELESAHSGISSGPHLDSDSLKRHLSEQGFGGDLDRLLSPDVLLHGSFARPGASQQAAREGFMHVVALLQERGTRGSAAEAAQALGAAMDDKTLARLRAIQAEGEDGETLRLASARYVAVEEGEG